MKVSVRSGRGVFKIYQISMMQTFSCQLCNKSPPQVFERILHKPLRSFMEHILRNCKVIWKKNWREIVPLYWDWTRLMIMMCNRTSLVFLSIWYFLLWIDLVFLFDLVDKSNKGKDTINPLQLFEKGQFFNHNNQWLNNIYH